MATNLAPYRFAARAAVFLAVAAGVVFGADRAATALCLRGVRVVPKMPPPDFWKLVESRDRVLVTGDSVIQFVPPAERGQPSLFELLAKESPVPLVDVSWPARAVDMYEAQIAAVARFDLRPRAIVLEVNLRQFSPPWEARPNLQEPYLVPMLRTGAFLPLRAAAVFKCRFGARSVDDFLRTPLVVGAERIGTVADLRPRPWFSEEEADPKALGRLRSLATCAFDFAASESLGRLRAAVETVRERGLVCVAFVTPLDVELIRALVSAEESARVEENLRLLRAEVDKPWIRVVDLSTSLPTSSFDHVVSGPDEHLRLAGRQLVAARLGEALRAVLRN